MKKNKLLMIACFLLSIATSAQFQLNTVPPLNGGNGTAGIAFGVRAVQTVKIDTIFCTFNATGTTDVWYTDTDTTGPPNITAANGWTQIGTATIASGANGAGSITAIPLAINIVLTPGTNYRFYVNGSLGAPVAYTTGTAGASAPFTDGIVTIETGNLIGYGGAVPNPNFHPRQFNGGLKYSILGGANDAAVLSVDSPGVYCSGAQPIVATIANFGSNQIDSVEVHWSVNGVVQPMYLHTSTLDTLNGAGTNTAQVNLGSFTFPQGLNNITIYTANPNGVADTSNFNDTATVFSGPSLVGNYTIDSTIVSGGYNFQSFSELALALNTFGVCGPVHITVTADVYNDVFNLNDVVGLSAINTLTVDGVDSSTTTIINNQSSSSTIIGLSGVSYTTIKNLTVISTNTATTDHYGIHLSNASNYDSIVNCHVMMNPTNTVGAHPIGASSSSTNNFGEGDNANFTVVMNNRFDGGDYSVHFEGGTAGSWNVGNKFINNTCFNMDEYGFYFDEQDSLEVIGNTVSGNRNVNGDGIYGFDCMNFKINENNVQVPDWGIYFSDANSDRSPDRPAEIINNMVISNADFGIYLIDALRVNVWHNSVYTESTFSEAFSVIGIASDSLDVRNNIFSAINFVAFETGEPDSIFLKLDNNVYYSNGANLLNIDGTLYTDLLAYQTAQPNLNAGSIEVDPQFASTNDLHIVGANVNDMGDNSVPVTVDIDGDIRPIAGATIVDPGADEYDPPMCPPPTNLNSVNASLDSVTIFWDGGGNSYLYEVVPAGNAQGVGVVLSGTTTSDSIRIGQLLPSTSYSYYIREACSRGDTSIWVGPEDFDMANGVPFFENFETFNIGQPPFPKGWTVGPLAGPNWQVNTQTGSVGTGPVADHTIGSGGKFVYLETSTGTGSQELISPPVFIDLTQPTVTLSFWYHKHGATMDDLDVYVDDGTNRTLIGTIVGQTHPNQTDPWLQYTASLTGYAGQSIQIVFDGIRGTSFTGDMAIDDVEIFEPQPLDASVVEIISPNDGCGLTNTDSVVITIVNAGLNNLDTIPLAYEFNGGSAVIDTLFASPSLMPGDSIQFTFNATVNASAIQTHNIIAYSTLVNDGNIFNDTTDKDFINIPVVSTFPYTEDFETSNGGWTTYGTNSSWAWGTPSGTFIPSAAGGTGAWVTNLTGLYNNNEMSYLESPCLDLSSLVADPVLNFSLIFDSETNFDEGWVEFSTDAGVTWTKLIDNGGAQEWYNDLANQWWEGSSSGGSAVWVNAENDLIGLAGQSSVKIRFVFSSDGVINQEGFGIDNIQIDLPPSIDGAVTDIISPTSGCGLGASDSVVVEISNVGSSNISNFPVYYNFNGVTTVVDTFPGILTPGSSVNFTFDSTINLSTPGNYSLVAYTDVPMDADSTNDTSSAVIVSIPIVGGFPYSESFETGTAGWNAGGVTTFAHGIPSGAIINTASNGVMAWVTNLTGLYNNGEAGWVESPCFDFATMVSPIIELDVWWNSEFSWDGAVLQSSIDGGITWQKVGAFGDPNNWYTDNTINGLAGIEPSQEGWSGRNSSSNGSGGWVRARHDLSGLGGVNGVILRIAFGSDGSVNDEGFGFDNVAIFESPAHDIGVVDIQTPVSGAYVSLSDSVRITLANFGSDTATNFTVNYSLNGAPAVTDTISILLAGDTINYTFMMPVALPVPGNTSTLDVYTAWANDSINNNDSILGHQFENLLKTIPFFEDFETFGNQINGINFRGWSNANGGVTPDWSSGMNTPSTGTGPVTDHTIGAGGTFMYMETSGGFNGTDTLWSPTVLIPPTMPNIDLTYWYHMHGAAMGTLEVWYVSNGVLAFLDTLVGQKHPNQTDPWLGDTITISGVAGLAVQIVFVGINGTTFTSDMAIDDVSLDSSLNIVTGINNNALNESSFNIYPNPSNGTFNLDISVKQSERFNLTVLDAKGRIVHENQLIVNGRHREQLDLSGFAKGLYYLRMRTLNGITVKKLIVR